MEDRTETADLDGWLSIYRRYAMRGAVEWSADGESFLERLARHAGLVAESARDLARALADTKLQGDETAPQRVARLFADLPGRPDQREALLRYASASLEPGGLFLVRAERGTDIERWVAGEAALFCRGRHPYGSSCLYAIGKRAERPRIALLPDSSGACMQIRTFGPLEELERRGRVQLKLLPGDAEPEALVDQDLLLLQRFGGMPALRLMLEARELGIPVALELDDDFFHLPWFNPGARIYGRYEIQVALRALLRGADAIVTSTPYLRDRMRQYNARVLTMHNLVDTDLFRREPGPFHDDAITTFGYIGTKTHQEDFRPVIEPLTRLIEEHDGEVRAVFVGHVPDELARLPHVRYLGWYNDYHNAAGALTRCGANVALAPLMDVEFNRSKSAMKYLEYGACGIPGLFSDVEAYRDFIRDGETGLLVPEHTPAAWYEAMRRVVDEPGLRDRMADAAHRDVNDHHSIERRASDFFGLYAEVLEAGSGPEATPLVAEDQERHVWTVIIRADREPVTELPVFGQLRDRVPEGSQIIVIARDAHLRKTLQFGAQVEIVDGRQPGAEAEAIARARGEWILLLDSRAEIADDTCERLLAVAGPSVGALGPRVRHPSSEQAIAAVISGPDAGDDALAGLAASQPSSRAPVLDSRCVLLNRHALTQIGGVIGGLAWEDALTDLCVRLVGDRYEVRISNLCAIEIERGAESRDAAVRLSSRRQLGTLLADRELPDSFGSLRRPSRLMGATGPPLQICIWSRPASPYLEECVDRLHRHADVPFVLTIALDDDDVSGHQHARTADAQVIGHPEASSLADLLEQVADREGSGRRILCLHDGVMISPGLVAEMVDLALTGDHSVVVPYCNDGDPKQRLNVARGLPFEQLDLWIEKRIGDRHDETPVIKKWSPSCALYDLRQGIPSAWRGRRGVVRAVLASRAYAHVLSYPEAILRGLGPWPAGPFDLDLPSMADLTEITPRSIAELPAFVHQLRPLLAALKRNPNAARVLAGVGLLHATRGDFQEGMNLMRRAEKIDPFDPTIRQARRRVRVLLDGAHSSGTAMEGAVG